MSAHTPGPWRQDCDGRVVGGGQLIASAWFPRAMPDPSEERAPGESWLDASIRLTPLRDAIESEMDANARLIAAAPDLLAVVQMVANLGEYRQIVDDMATALRPHERAAFVKLFLEDARAAIAKATGSAS